MMKLEHETDTRDGVEGFHYRSKEETEQSPIQCQTLTLVWPGDDRVCNKLLPTRAKVMVAKTP